MEIGGGALKEFSRKKELGDRIKGERGRLWLEQVNLRERALFEELREREQNQSEAERAAKFFEELREHDRLAELARESGDVRILVQQMEAEQAQEQAVRQLRRMEAMKSIFTRRELQLALDKQRLGSRVNEIEARVKRVPLPLTARVKWTPGRAKAILNAAMLEHLLAQSALRKSLAEKIIRRARRF